ncbi:hypothetical protein [Pseudophaeobacter leonis]|uniref:hypothetical protein n=1 Tax=Pseudophaeobacter leonis TaxID=1144477 RepID=UPI0009F512C8|nr:hypothetical protein [Pseudophaeobacter leonis]
MPNFEFSNTPIASHPDQLTIQDTEAINEAFDKVFYLEKYPDVRMAGIDPLLHYFLHGWYEGRDPSPHFSTSYYLENNPDIAKSGNNPLWHYVTIGRQEGKASQPGSAIYDLEPCYEAAAIEPFFDANFYLAANSDVADAGLDPLTHYLMQGWREGRDPHPDFSTTFYLEENKDVSDKGINPFWHYVVAGRDEGRGALPPEAVPGGGAEEQLNTEEFSELAHISEEKLVYEMNTINDEFDTVFYLSKYPDIKQAGVDPLMHFVLSGWKEGRDPNSNFSVDYYLEANPDIKASGINPFWHYVIGGRAEGRNPRHPGGFVAEKLITQLPLEDIVAQWHSGETPKRWLDAKNISRTILKAVGRQHNKKLLLSVGHDNYREIAGGIQYCIQREEELSAENGVIYLNLHPYQPLPRLAHAAEDPDVAVNLILGRDMLGAARMSQLILATEMLAEKLPDIHVVVHHLLGHHPEQVTDLVLATGKNQCHFWTHDFFSVCPSYALQRNDVTFCGAPPVESNACTLCFYGEERVQHQKRLQSFFERLDVHVLSPSEFCADLWGARFGAKAGKLDVHQHVSLDWIAREGATPKDADKITIAFLGYPARHKGWNVFDHLLKSFKDDQNFDFVYLGTNPPPSALVRHVPVSVTSDNPSAMIDAVADEKTDIVLHWATCPETFSLSTFEALAGGAFVLTNPNSGNVAATVEKLGRGRVLAGEDDLVDFLTDGRAKNMVEKLRTERKKTMVSRSVSAMSFDFLNKTSDK